MTEKREEERAGRALSSSSESPADSISFFSHREENENESGSSQKQTPDAQEVSHPAPPSERERCLEVVRRVLLGEPRPHSLEAAVLTIEKELSGAGE